MRGDVCRSEQKRGGGEMKTTPNKMKTQKKKGRRGRKGTREGSWGKMCKLLVLSNEHEKKEEEGKVEWWHALDAHLNSVITNQEHVQMVVWGPILARSG